MPFLNRILFVLCFSTSALAQASYFAGAVPLTNTRYGAVVDGATERATDQELVATASTANTTLIVWNENEDAYLGIRARNAWRELRLAVNERAVAVAGELAITENDAGWMASWLDEQGAVVRQSPRIASFRARAVAVAHDAVVVGEQDGNVISVRVGRDGSVTEAVTLRSGAEDPAIATDGTSFVAVWETDADAIEATKLDGTNVIVSGAAAEDPAIAFNGRDYVVVWRGGPYLKARRVAADGIPVDEHVQISRANGEAPHSIAIARVGDGIGLTWFDGRSQVALYDFTPRWTVRTALGFDAHAEAAPRIVALPDQRAAFVQSAVHAAEPHHGSTRLTLSVAHPAPTLASDAPLAAVSKSGSRLRVAWTPPTQAVNGYRVEYRIHGGPWLEYEGWSDAGTNELLLEPRRNGTYQLRVRAWSDAGTSAYSEPVQVEVTAGGKRRAVR